MQEQKAQRAAVDYRRPHDAAALDRTIEREIIPRLLMTHRTSVAPSREGMPPDVIMMDLLAPSPTRSAKCDIGMSSGSSTSPPRLAGSSASCASSGSGSCSSPGRSNSPGRILASSLRGKQHRRALYIVAEFFYSDGWGVVIGPPTEETPTPQLVASEWFDLVAFSVSRDDALLPLRHEIAATRRRSLNPRVRILVGGHAVNEHRDAVKLLGADARATDPHDAIRVAHQLLAEASLSK